jgi:hypothetical protein
MFGQPLCVIALLLRAAAAVQLSMSMRTRRSKGLGGRRTARMQEIPHVIADQREETHIADITAREVEQGSAGLPVVYGPSWRL